MSFIPERPTDVPHMQRMPGMDIDFDDYQRVALRLAELESRIVADPAHATDADEAERKRLGWELVKHNRAYSTWLDTRIRAMKRRIARRGFLGAMAILMLSILVTWLLRQAGFDP